MKLDESYVNCFGEDKKKYINDVISILEKSYAPIGGIKGLNSPDELLKDNVFFKLVRRGGRIVSCAVYTYNSPSSSTVSLFDPKRNERKLKYLGSDGSKEGVAGVKDIMSEDINRHERGFWGEISGRKMEHMYIESRGAVPIPNEIAVDVLRSINKDVTSLDDDGYHYWRYIGDENKRKIMIGNANIRNQGLNKNPDAVDIFDMAPEYDINNADVYENLSIIDYFKEASK